ncbi:MAG: hypothetical protein M0D55_09240 [Elusimicrobiota bacterium]|nr:MAG: hypothetical protein M0D55_09240 [Elusimicrobiota bacterium]
MITLAAALALLVCAPAAAAVPDRIVVITDSHGVGSFGEALEAWLRARPDTDWDFFAAGGSAPRQWASSRWTTPCGYHATSAGPAVKRACREETVPHLDELWAAQPAGTSKTRRVTIIAHGTNYALDAKASEAASTLPLLKAAFKASDVCVWIGPPNMTRSPGFDASGVAYKYSIIEAALAAAKKTGHVCSLVDSRPLSSYPKLGGDGIHYHWLKTKDPDSLSQGPKWGAAVAAKLDALLPR